VVRSRPSGLALAAVLVLVAVLALVTASPPAAAPAGAAERRACPDVLVLGARGSGQRAGAGPEVGRLAGRLGDVDRVGSVALIPVRYDASPFGGPLLDPLGFERAVRSGAGRLLAQTAREVRRCPAADLVWAGFSQGALVVRAAMDRVEADEVAAVAAVVLLADPARMPGDVVDRGPAASSAGTGPARGRAVPSAWAERTTSWCIAGDPVCDSGADRPLAGLLAHAQGYRDPAVLAPVVEAVVDSVTGLRARGG
jgi:hypothetical protein